MGVPPFLQQDARLQVDALTGLADDQDFPIARKFAEACPELAERNIDRFCCLLHIELHGLSHIEKNCQGL
jgi:hypothetical protein